MKELIPSFIGYAAGIDGPYFLLKDIAINYRIVILMADTQLSREMICLAYHAIPQVIFPLLIEKSKDHAIS